MSQAQKIGFIKRAAQYNVSPMEAEAVFNKMAGQFGQQGGQPPQHGQPPAQHSQSAQGGASVIVNGQPLPPELAHVVIQLLQKLQEGGGQGGQPGGM